MHSRIAERECVSAVRRRLSPTSRPGKPRAGQSCQSGPGLTRRQKRLLVVGRLVEADAEGLSDRAIARELGVSQPFVSAIRRRAGRRPVERGNRALETLNGAGASERQDTSRGGQLLSVEVHEATGAQQWLNRNHDAWSSLGPVRRVAWPASWDGPRALADADPYGDPGK